MAPDIETRRHNSAGTLELCDKLKSVYAATHADVAHDPWYHPDRFWERLVDLYAPGRDFEMVTGWQDGRLVGYAFGSPRDNAALLWDEAAAAIPLSGADVTQPIYIFREFAVDPDHQRRGIGRVLHDELLAPRPEPLASLLVRQDNTPARMAYLSWGWRKIGIKQPFEDAPVCDQMIKVLPVP